MRLVPDEALDVVAPGEAFGFALLVLPDALGEIGRHADIERAVALAGEDVDARAAGHGRKVAQCDGRGNCAARAHSRHRHPGAGRGPGAI